MGWGNAWTPAGIWAAVGDCDILARRSDGVMYSALQCGHNTPHRYERRRGGDDECCRHCRCLNDKNPQPLMMAGRPVQRAGNMSRRRDDPPRLPRKQKPFCNSPPICFNRTQEVGSVHCLQTTNNAAPLAISVSPPQSPSHHTCLALTHTPPSRPQCTPSFASQFTVPKPKCSAKCRS